MPILSSDWRRIKSKYDTRVGDRTDELFVTRSRCLDEIMRYLNVAASAMYIRKYNDDSANMEARQMFEYLRGSFSNMLLQSSWLDPKIKKSAISKVISMKLRLGFPQSLNNDTRIERFYEGLNLLSDSYYQNILNINRWARNFFWRLRRGVPDRNNWSYFNLFPMDMTFYYQTGNFVSFPSSQLKASPFNFSYPKYLSFGSTGWMIGHEISHAFDSDGRKYDWTDGVGHDDVWDKRMDAEFGSRVACLRRQFDGYFIPEVEANINGSQTLDENLADTEGLRTAFQAYQMYVRAQGPEASLPGLELDQNQLFWVAAASVWCSKWTPEFVGKSLESDGHTPERFRVLGSVSNLAEFSEAFKCPPGSKMNPRDKCSLW